MQLLNGSADYKGDEARAEAASEFDALVDKGLPHDQAFLKGDKRDGARAKAATEFDAKVGKGLPHDRAFFEVTRETELVRRLLLSLMQEWDQALPCDKGDEDRAEAATEFDPGVVSRAAA
eukprot:gene28260-31366_t